MLTVQDQNGNFYSQTVNAADGSLRLTPTSGVTPSGSGGAPSFYGQDMINRAARAAHIISSGEQFQGTEMHDALTMTTACRTRGTLSG